MKLLRLFGSFFGTLRGSLAALVATAIMAFVIALPLTMTIGFRAPTASSVRFDHRMPTLQIAPAFAYADEVAKDIKPIEVPEGEVSDVSFFGAVIQAFTDAQGAGGLAIGYIVVQLLLLFLKSPLGGSLLKGVEGNAKLTIAVVLSYVGGILGMVVVSHVPLAEALVGSLKLPAFAVLVNQLWKYWAEGKK